MESLQSFLLVVQVVVAVSLIGFILIQHGKGADAGAAFGSGASSTVFGAQGSGNFLTRTTSVLAFIFLANSLGLGYLATLRIEAVESLMEQEVVGVVQEVQVEQQDSAMEDIPVTSESDVPMIPE